MPQILLVEDDPDICKLIQIITKDCGYELLVAEDEDEALYFLEEEWPELVLIDPVQTKANILKLSDRLNDETIDDTTNAIMYSVIPEHLIELNGNLTKSGLDGYLSKLSSNQSLLEEIGKYIT